MKTAIYIEQQHHQEYFSMQSNKSSIETKYQQLADKMAKAAGVKLQDLTKVQQAVIFAHAANQEYGLQCVTRNLEVVQFPQNWSEAKEGVYRFNYRLKDQNQGKKQNESKIVQFRFVNNQQEDGNISINYSLEDSEDLNQFELKFDSQKNEESWKNYLKHLGQKLKQKKQGEPQRQTILQPQWRPQVPNLQNPRQPYPLFVPSQSNNPFQMPYGGGQYIGPDNQIFRGRGNNNIFGPLSSDPYSVNDPRRPIGSRFDPIDPFGSQGVDERPRGTRDFMGFNEFGQPLGGNRGGFNPGKFM